MVVADGFGEVGGPGGADAGRRQGLSPAAEFHPPERFIWLVAGWGSEQRFRVGDIYFPFGYTASAERSYCMPPPRAKHANAQGRRREPLLPGKPTDTR